MALRGSSYQHQQPDIPPSAASANASSAASAFRRMRRSSKPTPASLFFGSPTPIQSSATTTPSPAPSPTTANHNGQTPTSPSSSHSIFSLSSIFSKMPTSSSSSMSAAERRLSKSGGGGGDDYLIGEARAQAVRSAKIIVAGVKNDWDWDEIQARGTQHAVKRRRKSSTNKSTSSTINASIQSPVESTISETSTAATEEGDEQFSSDISTPSSTYSYRSRYDSSDNDTSDNEKSAYRFDSPETVGKEVSKEEKKRKRKQDMIEEMKWNEGLRCWSARRDCWTAADEEGRVKVGRSMFDDNPLKKFIRPDQYPQIYSKVIVNATTPPIPINLQDLTNSLVLGWKNDDQWPPKPARPEPMFTTRRKVISGVGESMVKKVFGGFGSR